jgi:hypothetical protein
MIWKDDADASHPRHGDLFYGRQASKGFQSLVTSTWVSQKGALTPCLGKHLDTLPIGRNGVPMGRIPGFDEFVCFHLAACRLKVFA